MRVLLMSVKAGYGHHSTAKAIMNCFEENGHTCDMLDMFTYINKRLGDTIQDGYLLSTKYFSKAYGKVYDYLNKEDEPYDKTSVASFVSEIISKKLIGYIEDFGPDLIIGTHSYAGVVMSVLKDKKIIGCPLLGIVTDFTVHPFWENTSLDYYVVPDAQLTYQMGKKGIAKEKIIPLGIPVKKSFASKLSKSAACAQLDIEEKMTILVMMGSMGYGNIKDTLLEIDDFEGDFQVIVVCGSNEKIKAFVDETRWKKNIHSYGFVNNVDVMMDASDIIITKPGGLTASEAMAKGMPLIVMNPIPGQEDKNLAFLVNNGAAVAVNNEYTISDALYQLTSSNWRVELMKQSVDHIGKPNSAENLYNFIMENILCSESEKELSGEISL